MNQHSSSFDGQALGEQIVASVRDFMQRKTEELTGRIRVLESALTNGPYQAGKVYPADAVVSHAGGLWRTAYKTASQPGDGRAWLPVLNDKESES